jgi:hypothetical protein
MPSTLQPLDPRIPACRCPHPVTAQAPIIAAQVEAWLRLLHRLAASPPPPPRPPVRLPADREAA